MNIDPLSNSNYIAPKSLNGRAGNNEDLPLSDPGADSVSTATSGNVRASLAAMPEIRPEVVERGRQLAADTNYPSQEIVNKIARLITPLSED